MKKILSVLCIATLLFASCSDEYDDSKLWQNVNDLKDRIASLEKTVQTMNSDISSIQSIVDAINARDYIVKIEELADKSGYTITFAKGNTITIKHGKDGIDGKDSPIIGIDIYEGIYYWTITTNGNKTWLLDNDGNKLKVPGDNGITPIIGIDTDGYWTIDMGNGVQRLKDANGEDVKAIGQDGTDGKDGVDGSSFFNNVRYDDNFVYFTFTDGKVVSIPLSKGVSFTVSNVSDRQLFVYGETRTFDIVQNNIAKISISKPDGWKVSVNTNQLTVIAPPKENTFAEESGEIAITAMGIDQKSFTLFSFNVEIDRTLIYFEDSKFKEYLLTNFDLNGDGSINVSNESFAIKDIDCSNKGINSIDEIKWFSNLSTLTCNDNNLTTLNVKCTGLNKLICNNNQLISLDVSWCKNLDYLNCSFNQLTVLNIENNSNLTTLYIANNQIKSIDLSKCENLMSLWCSDNQIKSLDISNCQRLEILHCYSNQLTTLDVSNCPKLKELNCSGNLNLSTIYLKDGQEIDKLLKNDYTQIVYK